MKNKIGFLFILFSFATLSISGQGIGDRNRAGDSEGTYTIQGRVYLPDGKKAQNVKIFVESTDSGTRTYLTNMDGIFQTGDIRAGRYTVVADLPGLPIEREFVTIGREEPAGRTFSVTLFLRNEGQQKGDFYSADPMFNTVPKAALDKYKKAKEKIEKNDAKGAIPLFDAAISGYPDFAVAYYDRGNAYLRLAEHDKALESFVKAVSIKPDYFEAKYSVGYTQYLKKNYEVAAAIFDDVLKEKKDLGEGWMYLGISLFYLKSIDAAEDRLKKALATPGGDNLAFAHLYLGQIYINKKKNSEAAAELEKYLVLVPKAANADKLRNTIAGLKKTT